jgi:hypothetical protein
MVLRTAYKYCNGVSEHWAGFLFKSGNHRLYHLENISLIFEDASIPLFSGPAGLHAHQRSSDAWPILPGHRKLGLEPNQHWILHLRTHPSGFKAGHCCCHTLLYFQTKTYSGRAWTDVTIIRHRNCSSLLSGHSIRPAC